ncbi:MAG: pyruvate formate lyase family protein [Eubacteriales bacterium]|nr:pyruvate formate lyase family protein [Eubacteriales bacterium]
MDEKGWKRRIQESVEAYKEIFDCYETEIPEEGLLAGFHRPVLRSRVKSETIRRLYESDNMHYPMGDAFLKYGIGGILERTRERQPQDTEETAAYRRGVYEIYKEVQAFIVRHAKKAEELAKETEDKKERMRLERIAKSCGRLAADAPKSFLEALQLFWFFYLLRSPFGGGCIGRLDQKLYPWCRMDLEKGGWDEEEALEGIMQFYRNLNRMNTGDTLRNLMLSGRNAAGEDETNELTYLFLEAYERTQDAEPHVNVRIHEKTPKRLKEMCIRMLAQGKGQPTLYFDRNLIPAMERAGIPREAACGYANDGCTETVYDGRGSIDFWQHEMVKTVELTVFNGKENPFIYPVKMKKSRREAEEFEPHTGLALGFCSGELSQMYCFSDFLDAFFAQLAFQITHWITIIDQKIEADETDTLTSPLIGGTLEKCVKTGRDPLRGGGFDVDNYQLLSGTVTTAADCLRAVEYGVFEKHYCTLTQLRDAMAADFEGYEPLRRRLLLAPKYGNGDARTDELAAMIAERFLQQVNAYRSRSGKRIRPGLYNIDFKIFANLTGATPDGRKFRDAIGEHCSPTPGAAKRGPTAVIESASRLPMQEGYASSVLQSTLDGSSFVMGAQRETIIAGLWEGAEKARIPVWNLTMYSREELLDAQKNPGNHQDLIVRVWGFNARFVELDEELQNHIINRIS